MKKIYIKGLPSSGGNSDLLLNYLTILMKAKGKTHMRNFVSSLGIFLLVLRELGLSFNLYSTYGQVLFLTRYCSLFTRSI